MMHSPAITLSNLIRKFRKFWCFYHHNINNDEHDNNSSRNNNDAISTTFLYYNSNSNSILIAPKSFQIIKQRVVNIM